MANYYNMQEVMEKLRKTEAEVQGLVKQGQLRQYLDSGKPVFKVEDVDNLTEEIVGLDISSAGLILDEGTALDLQLEETGGISLEPDESKAAAAKSKTAKPKPKKADDDEITLEPMSPESEGGFGLSQMGDLSMADTNVGTVGINILSGTDDAYKLSEDSKAETKAEGLQLEEAGGDELDSLDADSNLESFGSGSGLLDLSLQADDTSLGAVLDDILPAGAEGGPADAGDLPMDQGIGLMDEDESQARPRADAQRMPAGVSTEPMGVMGAAMPVGAGQMVAVMPVDPKTNIFGIAMFLPMLALILAGIVMTSAIQGVKPSLLTPLMETRIADINLIWIIAGVAILLLLLILLFAAMMGQERAPKAKKEKAPKAEKPKKKRK